MAKDEKRRVWTIQPVSKRDASELMVEFSPNVIARLGELEKAVRGRGPFDADIFKNLQGYAELRPMPMHRAISYIAHITREAEKYANMSLSKEADYAVSDLLGALSGETPCVRLVKVIDRGR